MNFRSLSNIIGRPAQLCLIITVVFVFVSYFDFFYYFLYDENLKASKIPMPKCNWQLGDPVFLNLKTALGVNYDGSHWFHMSENFMTYHSILRNEFVLNKENLEVHSDRYTQIMHAREVYLNFDKRKYIILCSIIFLDSNDML